jgi:uncharacterized membrane protein YfcA
VNTAELFSLIGLGLVAGVLGGLLGIGGSVVMIPVLTLLLGRNQQLSQAAAMIVNVCVALPAVLRHHRAGAVHWTLWQRMLPAGVTCIVIGVLVSNRVNADHLKLLFGVFLIYVIYINTMKLLGKMATADDSDGDRAGWIGASVIGGIMGFAAGLLGIGGGIIAVPLIQRIAHLPLRRCIATSAAVMAFTSIVGATQKNLTIHRIVDEANVPLDVMDSLQIAACLAPTAILGGLIGASLTHILPLKWIRAALIVLLSIASLKFLGVPIGF